MLSYLKEVIKQPKFDILSKEGCLILFILGGLYNSSRLFYLFIKTLFSLPSALVSILDT